MTPVGKLLMMDIKVGVMIQIQNYMKIFLHTIDLTNSYWFSSRHTIEFLLTNNHQPCHQLIKKVCKIVYGFSIFEKVRSMVGLKLK